MEPERARYGVVVRGAPPTGGPARMLLAPLGTVTVGDEERPMWSVLVLHPGGRRGVVQEATFGPDSVWVEERAR